MSMFLWITILTSGPLLGALGAIALGYARTWHLLLGAMLGQGVALSVGRVWSNYAAERAMRRALDAARNRRAATLDAGRAAARPTNVFVRATGLTWRDHLITAAAFSGFAMLVGGLVAIARSVVVAGH